MLKQFILILLLVLSSTALADAGDKEILFSGQTYKAVTPKKISIKTLESSFTLHTFEIYNPWEKQKATYTGILMNDLVQAYGYNTKSITVTAIDDYQITFTPDDWGKLQAMLVTRVNGHYLDVKNKGPMRVIYPNYDVSDKIYELSLSKWLWMIKRIELN